MLLQAPTFPCPAANASLFSGLVSAFPCWSHHAATKKKPIAIIPHAVLQPSPPAPVIWAFLPGHRRKNSKERGAWVSLGLLGNSGFLLWTMSQQRPCFSSRCMLTTSGGAGCHGRDIPLVPERVPSAAKPLGGSRSMSEPPRESLFALGFGCGGYVGGLLVCFKAWCVLSRAPRVIRVRFAQALVKG